MLGKSFSNVKTDSASHSSVDTIGKLGLIGKIIYVNTLVGLASRAHSLGESDCNFFKLAISQEHMC